MVGAWHPGERLPSRLKAPYLPSGSGSIRTSCRRVAPIRSHCLSSDGFDLKFDRAITIIVGENGTGKSTLLEAIAALAGYDRAGGGKGYPADRARPRAGEPTAAGLADALRAAWLPKLTNGWFFRAESFFTVARYLDDAAREPFSGPPPDYLAHSHGEGFLRFFEERCRRQGLFIFDEPELALSPRARSSS